ncbi:hypothetical protein U1Q18_052767 [Sarracenia purpurea var. burkii]
MPVPWLTRHRFPGREELQLKKGDLRRGDLEAVRRGGGRYRPGAARRIGGCLWQHLRGPLVLGSAIPSCLLVLGIQAASRYLQRARAAALSLRGL